MRLRKRWIGRQSQRGEIYVPEAVGAIVVANNGGSIVFYKADGVRNHKLANGDEGFAGDTRETSDTMGIGLEWRERDVGG